MGLDMYLQRKIYIQSWSDAYQVSVTFNGNPTTIQSQRVTYVVEEIGYWRKANAIHKWFVDNVQKGKDDCGEYYVSSEDLKKLHDICLQVLENPKDGNHLLPTVNGFFFGSTEYDDYYLDDVRHTVEVCAEALKLLEIDKRCSFYYSSSW
ncbi:MAG: hypothetical protein EB127_10190 [Alphaproteobacteria bacterium]|nr:hypothetical protein [Alphaproteobacteria bacterium]